MKQSIKLKVNGEIYELEIAPNRTLHEVLRENLELTGTKESCKTGECGACTVIMDGKSVLSCLLLALDAHGKDILTIEGLSKNGELHPLQKSFKEHGGLQCGYCTPGMVMTAKALLDENPHPSKDEIKEAIANNLCRCSGYNKIWESIEAVAKK